jgi:hypothetical protein
MNIRLSCLAFISAIVLTACVESKQESELTQESEVTAEMARGAQLLQPFKAQMQQALKAGMAEGPVQAIDACRIRAPEIAAALSKDGVRVGRASHKLRNPDNAGPHWVGPVLDEYLASDRREPVEVALENGYIGYAEPILVQPLCLTCHGEVLAPDLESTIGTLYPDDQATGYTDGDLRGVFWVEYPTHK